MTAALRYVNINGKLVPVENASVGYDNRAFRYGYGLFETMLVNEGEIELWAYHAERLFGGIKQLCFDIPVHFTIANIYEQIIKTVKKNKQEKLSRVRLQVFAGKGGLYDTTSQKPEYLVECFTLEPHVTGLNETGLVTGIANGLYKSDDSLSNLKTCNALIYAMAAQQAKTNKWNDALIYNTSGNIIESTIANIFWVKENMIHTPPLSQGCIAGVMRRHLLQSLPVLGYTVRESSLTVTDLYAADAVFLTNAVKKIKWVRSIDDQEYNIHIIPAMCEQLFG